MDTCFVRAHSASSVILYPPSPQARHEIPAPFRIWCDLELLTLCQMIAEERLRRCVAYLATASSGSGELLRVGAHKAWKDKNDPLQRAGLNDFRRTLLIEPQPQIFEELQAAALQEYPSRVAVANAAVCAKDARALTFYSGDPRASGIIGALSQAASTNYDHVLRHLSPAFKRAKSKGILGQNWTRAADLVVTQVVPCLSLVPTLMSMHGLSASRLRVLTIDAESTDVEIVESLPMHVFTDLKLLMWETNLIPPVEDAGRHARLRTLVERLERHHGFECRGWGSRRRRTPLNDRCILDEENVWCIHRSVARLPQCNVTAASITDNGGNRRMTQKAVRVRCRNQKAREYER